MEALESRLYLSSATGLRADYYDADPTVFSESSLAVAALPVVTETDPAVDFDWGTGAPTDGVSNQNFAVRWSGQVLSEAAGTYVFHVTTTAAIRLWVNGQEIISDYVQHPTTDDASTAIDLAANTYYDIQLDFAQGAPADDAVELDWVLPDGTREVVPQAQLYPFSQPITISSGGTYVGSWENTAASQTTMTIATTQPVTIDDSTINGAGILITNSVPGIQLTVENTSGYGLNPNVAGVAKGDFLYAQSPANLIVENNYIDNVGGYGIDVLGFVGTGSQTISILYNQMLNLDGRFSDGNGGYESTGEPTPHDIIFNSVQNAAGIEIGWNQIINQPFQSYVNDMINMYNSSGTPSSPIQIFNNYLQGLYAINPNTQYDSGCGICMDGGSKLSTETAYVDIYNNDIVSTGTGIGVAAGHDITVYNNELVSSGQLADGSTIYANTSAIYIEDLASGGSSATFFNNGATYNVAGWMDPPDSIQNGSSEYVQSDYYFADGTPSLTYNNLGMASVTLSTEAGLAANWLANLAANSLTVGPTGPSPLSAPPSSTSTTSGNGSGTTYPVDPSDPNDPMSPGNPHYHHRRHRNVVLGTVDGQLSTLQFVSS
jgi:hypothetical protein